MATALPGGERAIYATVPPPVNAPISDRSPPIKLVSNSGIKANSKRKLIRFSILRTMPRCCWSVNINLAAHARLNVG